MTEINPEFRLRVLEIAERTVHQPYMAQYGQHNGGSYDNYRDKDLNEIIIRADRLLNWCNNTGDTPNTLIDKLRSALCESK